MLGCQLVHNSYESLSNGDFNADVDTPAKAVASSLPGYQDLKKEQSTVINSFVSGNDVFAVLPTGFGKTLCYPLLLFGANGFPFP